MRTEVSVLDVLLHGAPIGTLTRVAGDRTLFAFDEAYVDDPARPVLGLGFKDSFGNLITAFRPTRTRLLPYFAGLLPEGRLRAFLAERAGVKPAREFFLLRALGRDLPGAVTVLPAGGDAQMPHTGEKIDIPDNASDDGLLRFSLAGVQLKFSVVNEASGGLTIPAKGVGGDWIVKLPSREYSGAPENEYSMMTLARLVGIDVPAGQLIDVEAIGNLPEGIGTLGGKAFAIRRFDRLADGTAVHIEDFAQVFGVYPEDKYGRASYRNIATVLAAEGDDRDCAEFIRRIVFNMLIGNADMHLKNWSLIYPDRRRASLAPAYDLVSTVPYIPDSQAALKVSRTSRFDEFTEDELIHLAAKAGLPVKPVVEAARETVEVFHRQWSTNKNDLPLSNDVVAAIDAHLRTVPIARTMSGIARRI